MKFELAPAPHAPVIVNVPLVMRRVLYALLPAALAYIWFFGPGLAINFCFALIAALLAEASILWIRKRAAGPAVTDGSAWVTAALLAFALPPLVPWWIPAIGGACAIVFGKQLYGGLGRNLFNPAMVGYVLLLISFPAEMTQWLPPRMGNLDYRHLNFAESLVYSLSTALPAELDLDGLTRATPLDLVRDGLKSGQSFSNLRAGSLFGDIGGRGWEWINAFIALGGLYLLYRGTIRWHIPIAVLASLSIPTAIFHFVDSSGFVSPGFQLFSGAALLGAFFIATDPVSTAASARGRLIFGAGIGVLTFAIRRWGGYPDGLAFAVLLMNAAVPLIDRYTRPTIYGRS